MLPTLRHGDLVLTLPSSGRVRPGDVVVADLPGVGPTIKRVAAAPWQDALLDDTALHLDGVSREEPRVTPGRGRHHWPPGDGVVLLGDHRDRSTDSRHVGRVPVSAITRRAVARVRPPRRLRPPP